MQTMVILTLIFALSCAVATFIENDFGTETAWAVVYKAHWFELLQLLLGINLFGNIIRFKLYKKEKWPAFVFHIGFLIILVGAAVTRYIGYEGIMHIREGKVQNQMISSEPYIQITAKKDGKIYHAEFQKLVSKISKNDFTLKLDMGGSDATVRYKKLLTQESANDPSKRDVVAMVVDLEYNGKHKEITLIGRGRGTKGLEKDVSIDGVDFVLEWGSKVITLPFSIKLRDFQLERYPGSMAPSSYASEVTVIDRKDNVKMDFRIYMNHVLDYKNYRFFQSSYDMDEKGTILSVNHDPGTPITYLGYFLLGLGLLFNLFNPKSRFRKLSVLVQKDMHLKEAFSFIFALFIFYALPQNLLAKGDNEALKTIKQLDKKHAERFGHLLVQGNMGRIKPIDTLAHEILNKVARKNSYMGLSADQIILSMMVKPKLWQKIPVINIPRSDKRLKKILGISPDARYASFSDFFDYSQKSPYKLAKFAEEASRKKSAVRNQFDKDVLKVDERVNIVYMMFMGEMFKIFPKPNDPNLKWYSPKSSISSFEPTVAEAIREILINYFDGINKGLQTGDFKDADKYLKVISAYQKKYGASIIPSENKVNLEIIYNKLNLFVQAMKIYLIAGLVLLFVIFAKMLKPSLKLNLLVKTALIAVVISFLIHTVGLGLRWYLAGHAPWSGAYESMLYIGWTMALSGIIFARQSILALTLMALLAGVTLFVAYLSGMDPQITNLVPVLKSYWLNIHVSVITASYGFLALSWLLGFFVLVLLIIRNPKNQKRSMQIQRSITEATRINEIAMILGLSLLTLGNFLGGVWANESWGRYWGWDPKETWAWISILVYAAVLHMRFVPKLNSQYAFAVASTLAYSSIIMTYFGVNFYLSGMHSYAAGDPVPVPTFVYYLVGIVSLVILAAYPKRLGKKL